ncbi:MAG: HAD family hydrolase [Proteobacteria bacterium]|nr:HAD family hydrolase [Pseudomonadota bacterium]
MPAPEVRPPAPPLRALLLDFDGTLADTLPGLRSVYHLFLERIGAVGQAPGFDSVNGADLSALIPDLCRQFAPADDPARAWREYWRQVEQAILCAAPAPGAGALMTWARQRGWHLGIATAGRTGLIAAWLQRHDLADFIDGIVGADICERGKPDPMPYLMLMDRLGVTPRGSIAIEDSVSGTASALAAGVEVIRLGDAGPASDAVCTVATLEAAHHYLASRFNQARSS